MKGSKRHRILDPDPQHWEIQVVENKKKSEKTSESQLLLVFLRQDSESDPIETGVDPA